MSMFPWGYKSPRLIPPLFFHLAASLLFLLLLPPAPSSPFFFFFCGGGAHCPWPWRGGLKGSAWHDSSSELRRHLPISPPSRLAWASLLSLFISCLSLRLSGHVFPLPVRLHVSCFVLLLPWIGWFSSPLSPVGSDKCCCSKAPMDPTLTSSVNTGSTD